MGYRKRRYFTEAECEFMWDRWQAGDSLHEIARLLDRGHGAVAGQISRTGGVRSVVAESVLLRHQLQVLKRPRQRAPDLRPVDRFIAGLCAGLMHPARILRSAVVLKPATIRCLNTSAGRPIYASSRLTRSRPFPMYLCHILSWNG